MAASVPAFAPRVRLPQMQVPSFRLDGAMQAALATLPSINAAAAMDTTVNATTRAVTYGGMVERPLSAAARGSGISPALKAARLLGRTLAVVVVGTSVLRGAQMVQKDGARSLVNTREGRGAVLGALGGAMVLIPTPATQLGGAAVLAAGAANELGAFRRFDRAA